MSLRLLFGSCVLLITSIVSASDRPNILWLTTEDMSPNLGSYGDAYADTPHLDRLAAEGIRFTRFFAESPMCAPSRATIITGMHNAPLGASRMRSHHRVAASVQPFPAYLREAGYYCTNNSKTDYNLARDASGKNDEFIAEGWDESSGRAHWKNRPAGKPFFAVFNYMDTHQSRTSRDPYETFVRNVQSRLPAARIHDPAKATLPPHYPDSAIARRTIARYYDCISTLDDFVAARLAELDAAGLRENTIVFFYSDHGAGLPTGKAYVSHFGLRCPLIVSLPKKYRHLAPPESVSERLVSFADLAPTVLTLAGLEVPTTMHGRPFLGRALPAPPRYVLGSRDRMDETLETTRWISDGRFLLVRSYRRDVPPDQQSLISWYNGMGELCQEIRSLKAREALSPQQEVFWSDRRPGVRLFDGDVDPWNLQDLARAPEHQARRAEMEQALERFALEERDLGFWPEPDLTEAEKQAPASELARDSDRYPLARLIETAKLENPSALQERLGDAHFAVRFWAVVGLAALGPEAKAHAAALRPLLQDPSASVRIEAAALLAKFEPTPAAIEVLVAALHHPNEWAACRAARGLEMLGARTRPYRTAMESALAARGESTNPGFSFSLRTALAGLENAP